MSNLRLARGNRAWGWIAAIPVVDLSDEPPPPGLSLKASEQPLGPPAPWRAPEAGDATHAALKQPVLPQWRRSRHAPPTHRATRCALPSKASFHNWRVLAALLAQKPRRESRVIPHTRGGCFRGAALPPSMKGRLP